MPSIPALKAEDYARDGSKTARRELRRDVRNQLGTSSDDAPTIVTALQAAKHLQKIVDAASNGAYGLAVFNFTTRTHEPIADVLARIHETIETNRERIAR